MIRSDRIISEKNLCYYRIVALFEGEKTMGKPVTLRGGRQASIDFPNVRAKPSNRRFNVLIGNSRIIRNVCVVQRGYLRELEDFPNLPRIGFLRAGEMIVFKDQKGNRIFASKWYTTPLSVVKRFVVES